MGRAEFLLRIRKAHTMHRNLARFAVALCCIAMAGCYNKVNQNGIVNVSFQLWVPLSMILGGLVLIPVGILLAVQKKYLWGILLIIAGPIAAGCVAPGMFLDKVVVSPNEFTSSHGFWWSQTTHRIQYNDLREVRVIVEETRNRRGTSKSYSFDCVFKDGRTERVPLGDLMRQAVPEMVAQFNQHGVIVHGAVNVPP